MVWVKNEDFSKQTKKELSLYEIALLQKIIRDLKIVFRSLLLKSPFTLHT